MNTPSSNAWRTYVFALPGQKAGPLAMGTGTTRAEALRDAYERLVQRRVAQAPGPGRVAAGRLQAAVAAATRRLDAANGAPADLRDDLTVLHEAPGRYRAVAQMGHSYVNDETYSIAVALSNDSTLAQHMAKVGYDPQKAQQLLEPAARREARQTKVDLRMVDWCEVTAEFFPDLDTESDPQGAPRASPVPDEGRLAGGLAAAASPVVERAAPDLATRRIDADVLEVLGLCRAEENVVRLPPRQLPRELYERLNKVLTALGGKWKGGKVQGFQFAEESGPILEVAVATGSFVRPQDFGFFWTPEPLVRRVIELADLEEGMTVLEPSAGRGALALAAAKIVGKENVACVELLPKNAGFLTAQGFHHVGMQDFLTLEPGQMPKFDRVLMNPPFSRLADVEHVMHAARFLKPDGRLVAITSTSWVHQKAARAAEFRDFFQESDGDCYEIAAGAFREAGTDVATRIVRMFAERFPENQVLRQAQRERQYA
ncbi:hypothetical protein [Ramlibacter sp. AN1133]|uniref:hypothetical protein n=1 Tax=Ramlibacter sp. AN1133 TaxID=3133429 RepID=UPI0030BF3A8C